MRIHTLLCTCGIFLILACARQSSPSGGDKDIFPPQPLYTDPPAFTTLFEGSEFIIEFDEYISADNLISQLIISPPLKNPPSYQIRGRKLKISWEEELLPDATYQFNFGKGVVDVNESNSNTDLTYVFSTGNFIDSLLIKGQLYSALTNEPVAKASVLLYRSLNDTVPGRALPDYFAVSREDGSFSVNYLPSDTFQIFVLKEENNNYTYDGPPEEVGFLNSVVYAQYGDSIINHNISMYTEPDSIQYIASSYGKDYGYYQIVFNIPTSNPEITFLPEGSEEALQAVNLLSSGGDTLQSWIKLPEVSPEEIEVLVKYDSSYADTLIWYLETDPKFKDKSKLTISSNSLRGKLDPGRNIELKFSNPLENIDTSLIALFEDSTVVSITAFEELDIFRRLGIGYPFKRTSNYNLVTSKGAFRDVYGNYSDSTGFAFGLQELDYFGNLKVRILSNESDNNGQRIIQLTDTKGGVLNEYILDASNEVNFGKLGPGKYGLRILHDSNLNGEWDPGNYRKRQQPEKLSIYNGPVEVRSNWDLELEWKPTNPFD